MDARLMAVVAEGTIGRIYLSPTEEQKCAAAEAAPLWKPEGDLAHNTRHMTPVIYGMTHWSEIFTERQLVALSTLVDLIGAVRERAENDARKIGAADSQGHADAIGTYLAFCISKLADRNCSLVSWASGREHVRNVFARQALSITWDFSETNPFSDSSGNFMGGIVSIYADLNQIIAEPQGHVRQKDAVIHGEGDQVFLITTDPPYYDNVPYADLSDFFYVWLRHTLGSVYPELFGTMLTPKGPELVADPFRQGGKEASRQFFESGMRRVFRRMCETAHPDFPVTVIYAFKQAETDDGDADGSDTGSSLASSTGWETMLDAIIGAGHQITGTWPMRTELARRMRGLGSNALASSIALVCRPRHKPRRPSPVVNSSLSFAPNSPKPCALFRRTISLQWTSPSPPLDRAWPCSPGMRQSWRPAASR